jgi:hypothetical protein
MKERKLVRKSWLRSTLHAKLCFQIMLLNYHAYGI